MPVHLLLQGIIIGIVVAVPVGPLGLLCINRALLMGPRCGLFSGFGIATADALAAGLVALGISLVSSFLLDHQILLRLVGGLFLCYLGFKIFTSVPVQSLSQENSVNGLLGAYATTFFLTISNPVTMLSFIAIYAGWGVESLSGHYFAAAVLTLGVFIGSSLWWVAFSIGLVMFRDRFNMQILTWIHRVSGALIGGFGGVVILSLWPTMGVWGIFF